MPARLGNFLIFVVLTIITIGLYPLFFFVTRQQETVELLKDIKEELNRRYYGSVRDNGVYFWFGGAWKSSVAWKTAERKGSSRTGLQRRVI